MLLREFVANFAEEASSNIILWETRAGMTFVLNLRLGNAVFSFSKKPVLLSTRSSNYI